VGVDFFLERVSPPSTYFTSFSQLFWVDRGPF